MRTVVDIEDQLASDLAAFQGKESLTAEEIAALVRDTLIEKASQFVHLRADQRAADALSQIRAASDARIAEIAAGITVTPDEGAA